MACMKLFTRGIEEASVFSKLAQSLLKQNRETILKNEENKIYENYHIISLPHPIKIIMLFFFFSFLLSLFQEQSIMQREAVEVVARKLCESERERENLIFISGSVGKSIMHNKRETERKRIKLKIRG
jgi:hypothetical protein